MKFRGAAVVALVISLVDTSNGFSFRTLATNESFQTSFRVHEFSQRRAFRPPPLNGAAISTNGDLLPGISTIDDYNNAILQQLHSLRQTPYFRLYSVDILGSCEYMPQELFECYSETCEIYPIDDDEVRSYNALPFPSSPHGTQSPPRAHL